MRRGNDDMEIVHTLVALLVYISEKADEFDTVFEIAPPDHPDRFATYVGGKARRVGK